MAQNDNANGPFEAIKEGVESLAKLFPVADLGNIFKADAGRLNGAQDWVNQHLGPASDMLPFADHHQAGHH
ncbi:MAG: hypothetical protein JSS86_00815 [Cyanobacteria bacterium SZAS LIN-2]|nr:hypothetical protein [Cyanobacteria bacterium SZAS LIN-3]MBS1994811.1 hypothetical protein [Cyanobacteria bacterium SZAS LIN-2]MBS2010803.1 hypothetical protein [Cyanobacteria bacterium SZAS TMP-1]